MLSSDPKFAPPSAGALNTEPSSQDFIFINKEDARKFMCKFRNCE